MTIIINGETFTFSDQSKVRGDGYDLYIEEPDFERSSEVKIGHFTSKHISLPEQVRKVVKLTSLEPCSKVYKDSKGNKRLYAYFDWKEKSKQSVL